MPREFHRSKRVAQRIKRVLSELIRSELRDPRIGFVTITDVVVSRDLAIAKVFFSVMGDAAHAERSPEALIGASGFLRRELARELKLRQVPELRFVPDRSVADAQRLSDLIDAARDRDTSETGDEAQ